MTLPGGSEGDGVVGLLIERGPGCRGPGLSLGSFAGATGSFLSGDCCSIGTVSRILVTRLSSSGRMVGYSVLSKGRKTSS
jgi:hypothetical protein